MPDKRRSKLVKIYSRNEKNMPCEFCNFFSDSEIRMRLHRKVKHNVFSKYNITSVSYNCGACRRKIKKCICPKH